MNDTAPRMAPASTTDPRISAPLFTRVNVPMRDRSPWVSDISGNDNHLGRTCATKRRRVGITTSLRSRSPVAAVQRADSGHRGIGVAATPCDHHGGATGADQADPEQEPEKSGATGVGQQ